MKDIELRKLLSRRDSAPRNERRANLVAQRRSLERPEIDEISAETFALCTGLPTMIASAASRSAFVVSATLRSFTVTALTDRAPRATASAIARVCPCWL